MSGGVGQTRSLLLPFGRLLAHQVTGPEAWRALGHRQWAVCSPVQLGATLTIPGLLDGNWGGGEAPNPQACCLLESSGWSHLGTHPAGAQGKGDSTRAFEDPSQGGSGALKGLSPSPWPFSLAEGCKGLEMCEGQKEPPCPSL